MSSDSSSDDQRGERVLVALLVAAVFLWVSPIRDSSGVPADLWVLTVGLVVIVGVAGTIGSRFLSIRD